MNKFPILGTNPQEYIPFDIIQKHEKQVMNIHGQTLLRLSERGGLDWKEIFAVLTDNSCENLDLEEARSKVLQIAYKNKSKSFKATYKCRQCGEIYFDGETGEDIASIATLEIAVRGCTQHGNGTFGVHRYNSHHCEDGSYGMADFMGFRKEE